MSQGARLAAVITVVAVAAIGLYFAVMAPPGPAPDAAGVPAQGEVTDPLALAPSSAPPPEAFGSPAPAEAPAASAVAPADASAVAPVAAAPQGSGAPMPTGAIAPAPPAQQPAAVAPQQDAGRSYTIKSGDTLEGIARRELGEGQRWKEIVQANPGLDPKNLKVGRSITLPGGSVAVAAPASGGGKEQPGEDRGASTYTVQKGDTLFGIARKVYGSAGDADIRRIVDANRGTLKSKDTSLKPGMKLSIPAKR